MKKFIKFLATLVASLLALTSFAACGTREEVNPSDSIDDSKTQINVSNYKGGFGDAWLYQAKAAFESKYAETSFEPGKKGVQVNITSSINDTAGSGFMTGLKSNANHVFFTEDVYYYPLVNGKYAADITDIVTEDLTAYGESRSIEDKLDPTLQDYFKVGGESYYALPHYEAFYGMVYDMDLFEEKSLWIMADGSYGKKASGKELAKGPDGAANTYDDGLPQTYDEFFALCDNMISKGITPFTWSGMHQVMSTQTMFQAYADYEGKDNFLLNYTHSGTATTLIDSIGNGSINADGTIGTMMPATEITEANASLLDRQAGKYAALNFMKRIATLEGGRPKYCTDLSFSNSESNLSAQETYLKSRLKGENPIAFLFDGTWWENEATDSGAFAMYEQEYGVSKAERNFGFMPFPKASASQVGSKRTIATNLNHTISFVNANIKDENILKAAKTFLQFMHTDAELQNFSVITGALKPFNYDIPESMMAEMTTFGKDILAMRANENIDIVYTYGATSDYINNTEDYYPGYAWKNGNTGGDPIKVFKDNSSLTVAQYFGYIVG